MSDLVERLQSHMGKADFGDVLRDCHLAADRIEKLENSIRLAVEELGWGELDQARRRLRDALEQGK
jgi:hypothetical protein